MKTKVKIIRWSKYFYFFKIISFEEKLDEEAAFHEQLSDIFRY